MFNKWVIVFVILIEFFIGIKGNDENRNIENQNAASVASNFDRFAQLTQQTLEKLRYVLAHWQEIPFQDQYNVGVYQQMLKNVVFEINHQRLTDQQIYEKEKLLRPAIESLNYCLRNVKALHQHGATARELLTREILQLRTATSQLIESNAQIRLRWNEIPNPIKNEIILGQQNLASIIRSNRLARSESLTARQILENRYTFIDTVRNMAIYYNLVLQYLGNQQLLRRSTLTQTENRELQNQGQLLGSGGQKRFNQEQGGSGNVKKPR